VDEAAAGAEFKIRMTTKSLVLKRGDPTRRRNDDYDVLEDGKVVGRIFHLEAAAPEGLALDVGERA